jgi:hypothetical protein
MYLKTQGSADIPSPPVRVNLKKNCWSTEDMTGSTLGTMFAIQSDECRRYFALLKVLPIRIRTRRTNGTDKGG